jgi:hypothetical protein
MVASLVVGHEPNAEDFLSDCQQWTSAEYIETRAEALPWHWKLVNRFR